MLMHQDRPMQKKISLRQQKPQLMDTTLMDMITEDLLQPTDMILMDTTEEDVLSMDMILMDMT